MFRRFIPPLRWASILLIFTVTAALSAPYAAIVIDVDSGEVLYEQNADNSLHPAGLTKLMTLYAAFDAIETGMVSLDDKITISLKLRLNHQLSWDSVQSRR
jgi:D-alanyl-D-alanine carboxypeptidase